MNRLKCNSHWETYRAMTQLYCSQCPQDLHGSTYQTIDKIMSNVWRPKTKTTHHFLKRTHAILKEVWSPSTLHIGGLDIWIKYCNNMSVKILWRAQNFDYRGTENMHPCHWSSHTICECCQDPMLWNWKDLRILEMQLYCPIVLGGIQGPEWCAIQ